MENFSAAEEYYDYLLNPFEMVLLSSDEAHDNGVDQLLSLQDCEINAQLSNIFLAPELQVQWPQPLSIHDINHGSFLCPSRFEGSDLPSPTPSQLPVTEPVEEVGSYTHINSAEEKKRTEDGNAVESSPVHGDSIKQIKADHFCSHPLFIRFLTGHIECCKVGVYDQTVVAQLDQLIDEYTRVLSNKSISSGSRPDLDQFMVAYCSMLESYQEELNHTFEETKEFLKTLEKRVAEMRMGDVKEVKEGMQSAVPRQRFQAMDMEVKLQATIDAMMEDGLPSLLNIQMSQSQIAQVTMEVKEAMNMQRARKFSRLPEDATKILQDWWEKSHETNPYPSKNDKLEFARCTGLEPKQIENWFSNQRKKSCATRGIF